MSQIHLLRSRLNAAMQALVMWTRHHRSALIISLGVLFLGLAFGPLVARQFVSSEILEKREHESADLARRRAEWFSRPRATANGHVPNELRLQALEQHDRMIRERGTFLDRLAPSLVTIDPSPSRWTPIGPQPTAGTFFFGDTSGRVTALAVDNCDATGNTVYLGGADGGVWKTTNGGQAWTPLTDQQPSLGTGSIDLDPNCTSGHTAAIYVGTGEANFAVDNVYGAGVLKSTDAGATWTHDLTFTGSALVSRLAGGPYIGSIAVDPNQPTTILAGVQATDMFGAPSGFSSGTYLSTDSGAHWALVGPSGAPSTSVRFDPGVSGTAYSAIANPFGNAALNGIYKSKDHGQTWTLLPSPASPVRLGRMSLALSPQGSPPALYVAIADAGDFSADLFGVFRSTDGGMTWMPLTSVPNFCSPQCWYDMTFDVAPGSSGNVLFAGGAAFAINAQPNQVAPTILRSTDGGTTWRDVSLDGSGKQLHVDHHAVAFNATGTKIYAGNDGGVWSSTDALNTAIAAGAQHWANLNSTLNITQFYPGNSIHPSTDQIIYGGTQDNGTEQFSGALAWSDTEACGDGGFTAIDQQTPTTIYASCQFSGPGTLNKNIMNGVPGTNGINWVPIDSGNGINYNDGGEFIPPFVIDSKSSQNLYFGTYRLYQTTNSGTSWQLISSDLTHNSGPDFINTISVAPGDSNTVYAGTSNGLIWKSANALQSPTFQEIDGPNQSKARAVTSIAVDGLNAGTAFAAYSGFVCSGACDSGAHIYFTTNSGAAWTAVDGNLPDIPVNDIVIDPMDATDNTVYIATDVGVFASANATVGSGTVWTPVATGLPKAVVLSLKLRNASRTLVAGTHGRGIWSLLLPNLPAYNLSTVNPASATAASGTFTLTATGTGFTSQSVINFNSNALSTNPLSATSLSANVPSADLACNGGVPVFVHDPGKGNTNALTFSFFGVCDFSFGTPTPSSNSVAAGTPANYTLPMSAVSGATGSPTMLACNSSPPQPTISCVFSKNPFTPGTDGASVSVTVSTQPHNVAVAVPANRFTPPATRASLLVIAVMIAIACLVYSLKFAARRRWMVAPASAAVFLVLGAMAACGGGGGGNNGGSGGTPAGTYTITFSGQASNFVHTSSGVQLVVH